MRFGLLLNIVFLVGFLVAGCSPPAQVNFDDEHCYLNQQPATIAQVEAEQSRLAHRVLSRQPIQTGITLLVLLIAGATYIDKLARLLSRRHADPSVQKSLTVTQRIRTIIDNSANHPVRYFAIVALTVTVILVGGGVYIYLDADKRASERALQQLQFCHLALKGAEEKTALDAQRQNLDQLQNTAGDIKALVDTLPPVEQRKAEELLGQMRSAIGNQHSLLARESAVAVAVQAGSEQIQKNLGLLAADVSGLRPLPSRLQDMSDALVRLEARTRLVDKGPKTLGDEFGEVNKGLAAIGDRVGQIDCSKARLASGKTIGETLAALSDQAQRPQPVCRCECQTVPRDAGSR